MAFLEAIIGENFCNLVVDNDFIGNKKHKP